uniref:COMM domain-containing protein 10 isoform X4 n=1 Tax=Doryrhamphus excisus TaxID=161450 RepID=UPI0025AE298C|nr:COMM domain-containing protein 10 isoform X4 [Doryrhamphus excisus]
MASVIKETQSIKEAVTLINGIDVNKFSRLISRIIQKLHLKGERTFSKEEEQKLQTALSLDKSSLNLVLETSAFILEQAVYHNIKPASLQQQLQAIHVNPDKADVFSQTWSTSGPELVDRLKRNIFAPKKDAPALTNTTFLSNCHMSAFEKTLLLCYPVASNNVFVNVLTSRSELQ